MRASLATGLLITQEPLNYMEMMEKEKVKKANIFDCIGRKKNNRSCSFVLTGISSAFELVYLFIFNLSRTLKKDFFPFINFYFSFLFDFLCFQFK